MAIVLKENEDKETAMFGETKSQMLEAYLDGDINSMHNIRDLNMYALSILSDVQEAMTRNQLEQARQWTNKAKFFISRAMTEARLQGK